jgi:hypothetical protein
MAIVFFSIFLFSDILQIMDCIDLHVHFFSVMKAPASENATNATLDIRGEGCGRKCEIPTKEKHLTICEWIAAKQRIIDKTKENRFPMNNNINLSNSSSSSSNKNGVHCNELDSMTISSDEGGVTDAATMSTISNETSHDAFEYYGGLTVPVTSLLVDINDNETTNGHDDVTNKRILIRPYEGVASRKNGLNSCERRPLQPSKEIISRRIEPKEVGLSEIDFYLNTCGPIWDIAFAPDSKTDNTFTCNPCSATSSSSTSTYTSTATLEKHLAVATSRIGWPQQSSSGK